MRYNLKYLPRTTTREVYKTLTHWLRLGQRRRIGPKEIEQRIRKGITNPEGCLNVE